MSLEILSVGHFRNLLSVEVMPAATNIIFGDNAAGKTSLLEAIHFLGRVRSFRATRAQQLITRGEESLLVRGQVREGDRLVQAAVQRFAHSTRVRIDGSDVRSLSALARHFPVQVINGESQRLLLDGPSVRRSFLNWTMFHVEHEYYTAWRRYDRAVRQRNAALKARDRRVVRSWEPELVAAGVQLGDSREALVADLEAELRPLLDEWLPGEEVVLSYRPGWAQDRSLEEVLNQNRDRELDAGYCLYGPHRSDVVVKAGGVEAQHRLSRGQQKLVVIALLLSQAMLLSRRAESRPILLIDDLPAELDEQRRAQVMQLLANTPVQSFITCVDRDALASFDSDTKWFHVEHGSYREVV